MLRVVACMIAGVVVMSVCWGRVESSRAIGRAEGEVGEWRGVATPDRHGADTQHTGCRVALNVARSTVYDGKESATVSRSHQESSRREEQDDRELI